VPYWPYPGRKIRWATFPVGEGGMNTFSENGNDFVGRLLHEGGVWRRTFLGFSQYQKCLYGVGGVAMNKQKASIC